MDLIKKANEIVNGRDSIYPKISERSFDYICAGVEIKMERMKDVINKMRKQGLVNEMILDENSKDTIIDLGAYLVEMFNRISEDDNPF
jgi:predicted transcriptional regulator